MDEHMHLLFVCNIAFRRLHVTKHWNRRKQCSVGANSAQPHGLITIPNGCPESVTVPNGYLVSFFVAVGCLCKPLAAYRQPRREQHAGASHTVPIPGVNPIKIYDIRMHEHIYMMCMQYFVSSLHPHGCKRWYAPSPRHLWPLLKWRWWFNVRSFFFFFLSCVCVRDLFLFDRLLVRIAG